MNRKIIAAVLGGALTATGALMAVGCDDGAHKHTYETDYVLATCTDIGFTLHSCSECDYMYADEFVLPYGHAYEYCVRFALEDDTDEPLVAAARNGGIADAFSDLPLANLIGEPLHATVVASNVDYSAYLDQMLEQAYGKNPPKKFNVYTFTKSECSFCDDGATHAAKLEIEVPIQALPSIPSVDLSGIDASDFFEITVEKEVAGALGFDGEEHGGASLSFGRPINVNSSDVGAVGTPYVFSNGVVTHGKVVSSGDAAGVSSSSTQLVISDAIEEISDDAFKDCAELKRGELPPRLKKIGARAFSSSKFDYVVVPKSLESVGENAFGDCKSMKYVFYCGTENEWNDIAFGENNGAFKSVPRYYYSETQPTEKGNFWHYENGSPVVW